MKWSVVSWVLLNLSLVFYLFVANVDCREIQRERCRFGRGGGLGGVFNPANWFLLLKSANFTASPVLV